MTAPKRPAHFSSKHSRRVLLGTLAAAALVCVAITIWGKIAAWQLEQRLRGYTQAGHPVNIAELSAYLPAAAAADNAANTYRDALLERSDYISSPRFAQDRRGIPMLDRRLRGPEHVDEESCRKAEDFLQAHARWVDMFRTIARAPVCASLDYRTRASYAGIRHPFLVALEHGVDLLCLQAVVHWYRDDFNATRQDLLAAKQLNARLLGEPFLVNTVGALSGEKLILGIAGEIAGEDTVTPKQARQLRQLCHPISKRWFRMSLTLERLAGLDFYNLRGTDDANLEEWHSFSYLQTMPLGAACGKVNEYLDYVDGCIGAFDLPAHQQLRHALSLEGYRTVERKRKNPLLSLAPPVGPLTYSYQRYLDQSSRLHRKLTELSQGVAPAATVAAAKPSP